MRVVCFVGSWNLKPELLWLSLWTLDFNLTLQKKSHSQCWVKVLGLPQEYWSPRIIFSITGGVGTPISLNEATTNRTFGHFSKVLVEVNLKDNLPDQILVEKEGKAKPIKKNELYINLEIENMDSLNLEELEKMELTPSDSLIKDPIVEELNAIRVEISPIALTSTTNAGLAKEVVNSIEVVNQAPFPSHMENVIVS
ncbi:hypothetical protein Lal_00021951 [Lupinus albus]|nr:hypothetical protein Lal_00021951 [Lupinus albus]